MLEVRDLTKRYGDLLAVENLSFHIDEGEFVTMLGPSGCGKSTTLHSIAGLVEPSEGNIFLRGEDVTDLPPNERNIGMAFQSTALFPHMTVEENIAYGLKMHDYGTEEIADRTAESLKLVDMPEHGDHYPSELSGGQQQRVSLARALAYEPDILLLDEPLTGLDRVLREEMRRWLMRIQQEVGVTTLYVTHDQEDALSMSDRVIVLNSGESQQIGNPEEIYERPANDFVASFVGKSTKFEGRVDQMEGKTVVQNASKPIVVEIDDYEVGESVTLYVRPEDIEVERPEDIEVELSTNTNRENQFPGVVTEIANLGNRAEVTIELEDGTSTLAHTPRFPDIKVNDEVIVTFDTNRVIVQ